jgi:hypothetical protein
MGMKTEAALVERVSGIDEYRESFRRIFPREGITLNTIAAPSPPLNDLSDLTH